MGPQLGRGLMIVDLLVGGLLDLLTLVLAAIDDVSLPGAASTALEDLATEIGGKLGGLDSVVPITEASVFVGWVLGTYVPVIVAYQVAHWIWTHLPIIGNGG